MLFPILNEPTPNTALRRWAHRLDRLCDTALAASVPLALIAALVALLAGCGGSDDAPPAPATNAALDATQVAEAQSALDRAGPALDAGQASLSAAQIEAARLALDGATTDGVATLEDNQTAMDTGDPLTSIF